MTLRRGDLVEFYADWDHDCSGSPIGRGQVWLLRANYDELLTIRLDASSRATLYGFYTRSRRPLTYTVRRACVRRIQPWQPGDPIRRYGPYRPIAKSLP